MKSLFAVLFGAALAFAGATGGRAADAPPRDQGPVYVTTFVEVTPAATAQTLGLLKTYREAARKEAGAMTSDVYQELGMPSRFVSNEVWRDWAAYDDHLKAAARAQLFQALLPIEFGPPDTRPHLLHFGAPGGGAAGPGSVIIFSHLDVTPNAIPRLLEIMKPLGEGTAKETGMQKYQIIRQAPGVGNHLRLFEEWASEKDWDAHNLAAHTQAFRKELAPMLGTPYDQRKYQVLN